MRAAALGATWRPSAAERRLRTARSTGDLVTHAQQNTSEVEFPERGMHTRQVSCARATEGSR